MKAFAAAVDEERIVLDRSVPLEDLVASITALPGLGPWTAHYVALRLGERDAFPTADLGLLRALNLKSPEELERRAESWRPWRAYAAMYLWSSPDDPKPPRKQAIAGKVPFEPIPHPRCVSITEA